MKIEYALRVTALKKYQPSMEEIRAAISELVWQKVEADKGRMERVEAGDFAVEISDVPDWVDESLSAARRRANTAQTRIGNILITAAKNLKDRNFSNSEIAKILGIKESAVRSSLERQR